MIVSRIGIPFSETLPVRRLTLDPRVTIAPEDIPRVISAPADGRFLGSSPIIPMIFLNS